MEEKRKFYEKYGAEEYYILYPDFPAYFQGWQRSADARVRNANMNGHVSPRLGIRFEVARGHTAMLWPNGQPFLSYAELGALRAQTEARVEHERLRADQAKQKAERLAAKLPGLSVDPDAV